MLSILYDCFLGDGFARPKQPGRTFNSLRLLHPHTAFFPLLKLFSLSILYDCFEIDINDIVEEIRDAFNSLRLLQNNRNRVNRSTSTSLSILYDCFGIFNNTEGGANNSVTFNSLRLLPSRRESLSRWSTYTLWSFNSLRLLRSTPGTYRPTASPGLSILYDCFLSYSRESLMLTLLDFQFFTIASRCQQKFCSVHLYNFQFFTIASCRGPPRGHGAGASPFNSLRLLRQHTSWHCSCPPPCLSILYNCFRFSDRVREPASKPHPFNSLRLLHSTGDNCLGISKSLLSILYDCFRACWGTSERWRSLSFNSLRLLQLKHREHRLLDRLLPFNSLRLLRIRYSAV